MSISRIRDRRFRIKILKTKASDDQLWEKFNFVARTERKFEKSIWVDWFSLQVQYSALGDGDVTQNSSQRRRNVKLPKAGKIDDRVDGPSELSVIESKDEDQLMRAFVVMHAKID